MGCFKSKLKFQEFLGYITAFPEHDYNDYNGSQ